MRFNAERGTRSAKLRTMLPAIVLASASLAATAVAQVNVEDLRRKQETQQRAAELARELVKNLLDVQMQQLEENGLTERPLYTDVRTMRENIDGLVEAEMTEVVSLLTKAQGDATARRDEVFLEARTKIGEVLSGLLAERQNLSRRLRTAEIAAQVRRLIDAETIVRDTTLALPTQTREQRETQQLATLADQRDAGKLFDKLVETLGEARGWGGEIARTAVDGLALLKASETGEHVVGAAAAIEMGDFSTAAEHETAAIRGLQVLLKKVKETQGLIEADRKAALEVVRELIRRQDELLEATKTAPAEEAATDELLKRQTALGRELSKLGDMVLDKPQAAPLVERAKQASESATVELFNQANQQAAKAQAVVRGNLAAVEKQLQDETSELPDDRDAERLAARAADLEKVRDALKQARTDLAPHAKAEAPPTPAVKAALEKTSKDVARAGHERDLPSVVEAKLRDAARTARDAAKGQDDPANDAAAKKRLLAKTEAALERTQAEVEAALADVRRMQPAVAAGELSRAAEALDRAAAAERDVAARAMDEAKRPAAEADAAALRRLTDDQRLAGEVAADVAQAVAKQAPEAMQALDEGRAAAAEALEQLTPPADGKPPAAQALRNAATKAGTAAGKLAAAAAQIRRQAAAQAMNLAREAERQMTAVRPAAQAADAAANMPNVGTAEARAALAAAKQSLDRAEAEQMRAAGQAEAADLHELAARIDEAAAMQQTATAAADDHAEGRSETPLDAVTMQQRAADELEKLAGQAAQRPTAKAAAAQRRPDPLVETLRTAQRAAQQAAKQTLEGKTPEATQARAEAMAALAEAAAAAKTEQAAAAAKPPTKPDAAAQQRAGAALAEAKKNAMAHAPLSAAPLDMAEKDSLAAEQAALAGKMPEAAKAQESVAKNVAQAKKALEQAQANLAAKGAQQMQQQAAAAQKLGDQAAPLDPGALQALREAQQTAAQAAAAPKPTPAMSATAEKQTAQAMQRAAASLAAREQLVKRDQQLAQALLNSLAQQQAAAQQIAAERGNLAQATAPKPTPPMPPAAGQPAPPAADPAAAQAAARKLEEAMQSFAQAAQVTGQAAQEVSGQSQVANAALAMALDKASGLPTPDASPAAAPPQPAGPQSADTQAGPAPKAPPRPQTPASEKPQAQMGKGLTPSSPEATAQMMAGPQAMKQMAQLQQSSAPPKPGSAPGQIPNAAAQQAKSGQPGPSNQTATSPQQQINRPSQGARDSSQPFVENTGRSTADVALQERKNPDEPWMAKLPAELRQAIRAEAGRPAPRGYEERLRNYFKNID